MPSCRHMCWVLAFLLVTLSGLSLSVTAAPPSAEELLQGADARIEKNRKGDAEITVVDGQGRPLPGVKVEVRQARHAFLFGANIFNWGKLSDPKLQAAYNDRFQALLNYATVPFYWPSYEPKQGEPIHAYTEQLTKWCKEQGIATKGHPLAWNYSDAPWYPNDPDELYRLQLERIDDCVKHFPGLIDRWDVVNEVTHFDRDEFAKSAPKHTAMWKKIGQIEFTKACFEQARKANPKATLLINDYRTDPPYEKVIEQLVGKDGKRLYDVIGIQSHMHGGIWPLPEAWQVCERYARFGVPLHFTEATILSGERVWENPKDPKWPSTPEGEASQARDVAKFYTLLFSHPAVEAITWWDFSDANAWKAAPAGLLRKDMTPKPAYDELMKLIKGKWWTTADLATGNDGKASLRGFYGAYTVKVQGANRAVVKTFTLDKNAVNHWTITVE